MSGRRPKLVILGSGFAAVSLLKQIDTDSYKTVVISPRNYFLFTPLLPSTTVGTLEFRSIIEPIRSAKKNTLYYQAECTKIDPGNATLQCSGTVSHKAFEVDYDVLVITVGAVNNTYGIPGVEKHTHFLRELSDGISAGFKQINTSDNGR
jgi:NADH:ubiquinone reductase (non-electrogenic)